MIQTVVFDTKPYDREALQNASTGLDIEWRFMDMRLTAETAFAAHGAQAVCTFVNDRPDRPCLEALAKLGVKHIALRCAGFNSIDLPAAKELGLAVTRVPAYSPYAVAEHAVALILALNRKVHRAYNRVRDNNFALHGLLGFDLHGRTVGVVGTGAIGTVFARIMTGFGCRVLASDPYPNDECRQIGVEYVGLDTLLAEADIVALHCPLTPETHHLIDEAALARMRDGVMLINTSRGGLVDATAAIEALKTAKIGYLGLDVYEEEADLFFEDHSGSVVRDDVFTRLLTFPNVLVTGHQAFFTEEAIHNIAATTIANVTAFETGEGELHEVTVPA
jgi:D-lactate dehydrogenase